MVYGYTKTTEYTRLNFLKLQTSISTLQKGASILMVYGYTKTIEYTRFNFRKLKNTILTYKRGFHIDGIRRLQSIQDLILEN
jgi:hypothetical protein